MYDNFSNFCRGMLAGENVQLFKLNKKTPLCYPLKNPEQVFPVRVSSSQQLQQSPLIFSLKPLGFGLGQMNELMLMRGSC